MRRTLVAAVALAPLCLAAGRSVAQTTDSITNGVSTPVATATAASGGASIDVTSGGSVSVTGSTPAVTLNSGTLAAPNNVSVEGSVNISGVNNSVGIQGLGGSVGSITNTGAISNSDSFSATTNGDGFLQAPFDDVSTNNTGRFGIQVTGTGPLVGDIDNLGTITVRGNQSYAISIESPLAASGSAGASGSLFNSGTISYTGDNGAAIRSTAGAVGGTTGGSIAGQVEITGTVTSQGTNSSAINLAGDVGGRISIYSAITNTGYATTVRPTTTSTLNDLQETANANQVEQAAGAVIVTGNVGGGILIGAPPVGTTTASTGDLDGDGIEDAAEGTGSITNYGTAPALTVGGTGATAIGAVGVDASSTGGQDNAYAVIIRGAVAGEGLFDGVTATGLQLGNPAGGSVSLAGGVRVVGSISADSFEADATAIHIYGGAVVPEIRNEDFIEASISNSVVASTDTAGTVNTNAIASGILIEKLANVSTITNIGTLQATANGDGMKAYAVRDLSGSVSSVLNEGVINAAVTPITANLIEPTGTNVALDLSANTTGVNLTQEVNPNPIAVEVSTTTDASGTVTTTAALTTATATTTTTVTTTTAGVTTTTTTTTPTFPQIVGDVLLGNGTNTVKILGGSVAGQLSLGNGANDTLTIGTLGDPTTNLAAAVALYDGALSYGGNSLAINVVNGSLVNTNPATLKLSSLHIGGSGLLYAAIDPTTGANTLYSVSGTATLDSGAKLGIVLNTPLFTPTTYTIIQAGSLVDNSGGALATTQVPYLLQGTETSDPATNTISVSLRRSTPAELGLNPAESAALNGVYSSLPNDPAIEAAVLGTYTKSAFLNVYDQLLPDYAGGIFQLTLAASDAVTRATSRVNDIENPSGTRGAWAEEVAFGVNKSRTANAAGYQGGGFGFVGGLETGGAGLGAFGLTGSFLTGDIKDPHAPGDNLSSFSEGEGGGYWQAQLGGLRADARVAGGYLLYANRRELLLKDANGNVTLDRASKASSSGYTATGHFGVGYQTPQFGAVYFRPQVHGDYFYLNQGSYTEHDGESAAGDGFDLSVAKRNGNEASGTASLVTGITFGQGFKWRPELEIGYRNVFSGTAGSTTANFQQGGLPFTLDPESIKGGGPVGRLDVKADTDFYELNFEAGAEQRAHFEEADLRLSVRVLF